MWGVLDHQLSDVGRRAKTGQPSGNGTPLTRKGRTSTDWSCISQRVLPGFCSCFAGTALPIPEFLRHQRCSTGREFSGQVARSIGLCYTTRNVEPIAPHKSGTYKRRISPYRNASVMPLVQITEDGVIVEVLLPICGK